MVTSDAWMLQSWRRLSGLVRKEADVSLTIYTKTGCPYCAAAKEHFAAEGVAYEEKNVSDDPSLIAELVSYSPDRLVPTIIDEGAVTIGWHGGG